MYCAIAVGSAASGGFLEGVTRFFSRPSGTYFYMTDAHYHILVMFTN